MSLRARLAAARPSARVYADAIAALPSDLAGLTATVSGLWIYPVKGFGGLEAERLRVDRRGLVEPSTGLADRGVLLAVPAPGATADGEPYDAVAITNREEGALSLATARLAGRDLVFDAPDLPPLVLRPEALAPRDGPRVRVRLFAAGALVEGVRLEGPLAEWTQALLSRHATSPRGAPKDLIAVAPSPTFHRPVAEKHRAGEIADTVFGDGAHLLVASDSTLRWMNDDLVRGGERRIPMGAFRPNVVLSGLPPNAEDVVREIELEGPDGPVPVLFATPCTRCDATRVDPASGRKPDRQPLAWLSKNRPPREGQPASATFAVNSVVRSDGHGRTLRAGARARVVAERS
ncbi:MAG: MOSC domain-containing protein [Methanobacteriota archaeon]